MSEAQLEPAAERGGELAHGESARAKPLWFGAAGRELFGLYHAPTAVGGDLAVLLCNPFGYEAMCAHRSYLHLADALAARGLAVLRFDYHGCGNSSGDDEDPDRVPAWCDSIHGAIDELRRLSGAARVGLFGLRLGANLALQVAAERADVSTLALWSPFATGRAFLREELAVHKLHAHIKGAKTSAEVEALGFAISAQTLAALEAHRVADLSKLHAASALVLTRDTPLQEERVVDKLRALGVAVSSGTGGGYSAMLADNVSPEATWSSVVDYFARQQSHGGTAPALRGGATFSGTAPALRGGATFSGTAPALRGGATFSGTAPALRGGATFASEARAARKNERLPTYASASVWNNTHSPAAVAERADYFGPGKRLFGVVTHAADRPVAGSDRGSLGLILIAGGTNHHVGQNRMFTRWARRWAAAGWNSLRCDLAGFGDSAAAHSGGDGKLHSPDSVADVRAAIDHLAAVSDARRFAVIGLCSGALQGFYAALEDPRIVSLGLLNWTRFVLDAPEQQAAAPEIAGAPEARYHTLRYYLRLATDPGIWRRLAKGDIDARGIAAHLATRALGRARAELSHRLPRLFGGAAVRTPLARDFIRLAERGVGSCVLYSGDESIIDIFHEQLGPHLGRLTRAGRLKLEVMDGTDHVFTPRWSQDRVFALMTQHVLGVAPASDEPTPLERAQP